MKYTHRIGTCALMRRQAKGLPELRAWRRVTYVSLLLFQEAKFFPKTRESLGGLVSSLVNGFLGRLGHLVHGFLSCICGLIHHLLNCCSSCSHWNREMWPLVPIETLLTTGPPHCHTHTPFCTLEYSVLQPEG